MLTQNNDGKDVQGRHPPAAQGMQMWRMDKARPGPPQSSQELNGAGERARASEGGWGSRRWRPVTKGSKVWEGC
jgi:hypothetical protein